MITFTSFPSALGGEYDAVRHHRETDNDMDVDLDDNDDFNSNGLRLTGHGTYVHEDQVVASVAGTVERVNKLITVRAIRTRYNPEVGDLVVGRITERRKLESDELQMRNFFEEGDLLVAEVQAFFSDGAMSLHTRSLKYGKVCRPRLNHIEIVFDSRRLVLVTQRPAGYHPPILVRRLKSHFITLPCGVDLILGLNGYIWVSRQIKASDLAGEEGFDAEAVYSNQNDVSASNCSSCQYNNVLAAHFVPLTDTILLEAYELSVEQGEANKGLFQEDVAEALVASLHSRS
ncbi:exosome non-catalytic core [Salix suchowensis]|nr:exosome non-catalytic core [Salix suchowensis]